MKKSSINIKISLLKLFNYFIATIFASVAATVGILSVFIINVDKDKITELNENISRLTVQKIDYENRMLRMNSNCDDKCNQLLISYKESYDNNKTNLIRKNEADFFTKTKEIKKKNKHRENILIKEISDLKRKLQVQKTNIMLMVELNKLNKEKENLKKQHNKLHKTWKDLNHSLAEFKSEVITSKLFNSYNKYGRIGGMEKAEYLKNCRMKEELEMEHERLKDFNNTIKSDIDSVNKQNVILCNKLKCY